jgi:hypothetical protein
MRHRRADLQVVERRQRRFSNINHGKKLPPFVASVNEGKST